MKLADLLTATHQIRVLDGNQNTLFEAVGDLGETVLCTFNSFIPMPDGIRMGVPEEVRDYLFPVNDLKDPPEQVPDFEVPNTMDQNSWAGWCYVFWGCVSDSLRASAYDDYTLNFSTVGGAPRNIMFAMARRLPLLSLHWRYLLGEYQTDMLLKGGGVFDITHDAFRLHPDEGDKWDDLHKPFLPQS